ncbi:Serine/threonine-protein kinase F [Acaryochloris thomasi RCC1774]|uniref:non-specific serine/threonine protein kinase n=1 Tax=Acaryochloris thomasi RCC1774 TaxID=1764569 RepID=A0A2W1JLN7_9CYAN|nr:serine/threonine-protein kinase [Acaryochloris thomasi]PZD74238.1 Serine/threonine-protein kinase F [Acaryochloris thomasi RCC1774]
MLKTLHSADEIVLGRYRIVTLIGQGSSGTTYEVEDLETYQRVALKAMSFRGMQNWKQLELFEREAQVLSCLKHPAIPQYLNYFQIDSEHDRLFYIAQALAPGKSLATLIEEGWCPNPAEVQRIARMTLNILIYLHGLTPPVVHRDIKPQNIVYSNDGHIHLVDFGAVQAVLRNTTVHGSTIVGTYGYMAPEQLQGQAYGATDLYALGATLLFLLTHICPGDLPQKRLKLLFREHLQGQIEPSFADWLDQMINPHLEDRFPTAQEALNALDQAPLRFMAPVLTRGELSQPVGSLVQLQRTNA